MKHGKMSGLLFALCALILLTNPALITQAEEADEEENHMEQDVNIEAESAILVDAKTGKILYENNATESLPPASMSKMMTEYLVLEAIGEGQFDWDSIVTASEYAHYLGALDGTSRVWLAEGEERTVEELYMAMAVYSGNDATVALAEHVAGSEADFVQMMNDKAEELGMTETTFVNSTGLPNRMLGTYMSTGEPEDENEMSARDTALLARELVNHYPEVLDFSSIPYKEVGYFDVDLINFNWMLEGHPEGQASPHAYPGVDGLKTGYTELAGHSFAGTAEQDDVRLITVVMRTDSEGERFEETAKLLDYGFDHYVHRELASEGTTLDEGETLPVADGTEEEVEVAVGDSIVTMIHEEEADLYSLQFEADPSLLTDEGELMAPVQEGDVVGEVTVAYEGGHTYDYIQGSSPQSAPVMATEDVEEAGWFTQMLRSIGGVFSGAWSSIVDTVTDWFS